MAVYRRDDPRLFERAVESVLANTLQPDDFVLVVDGPVPDTIEHVLRRLEHRGVLRTHRLPGNVGLARALNAGLEHVGTEWVARADADDINLPDRFERQALAIAASGGRLDLVGGAIIEVDRTGEPLAVREVPASEEDIARRMRTRNPFNHMTVAYRTAMVKRVGGYPVIDLKEDYALWAAMLASGARCANLADVLVHATTGREMYRRRGGLRHARSEVGLQVHLHRHGHKGLLSAVGCGTARAAVSCLPAGARGWMYERLLRRKHAGGAGQ
jgi:glycosyltransferase involved in cell wall biosynthesis